MGYRAGGKLRLTAVRCRRFSAFGMCLDPLPVEHTVDRVADLRDAGLAANDARVSNEQCLRLLHCRGIVSPARSAGRVSGALRAASS